MRSSPTPLRLLQPGLKGLWCSGRYDGFNINGSFEVEMVRNLYEAELFPRMSPNQRAFVVPGVFGCSATQGRVISPLAEQAAVVVDKLRLYKKWVDEEPRISGIHTWHWKNRSHHSGRQTSLDMARRHGAAVGAAGNLSLRPPPGYTQCGPVLTRPGHLCSPQEFCCASKLICLPKSVEQRMNALCTADPADKSKEVGHCECWMGAV